MCALLEQLLEEKLLETSQISVTDPHLELKYKYLYKNGV